MKNVTVTMGGSAADRTRMGAARRNAAVSRRAGATPTEEMRPDDADARATHDWVQRDGARAVSPFVVDAETPHS